MHLFLPPAVGRPGVVWFDKLAEFFHTGVIKTSVSAVCPLPFEPAFLGSWT